MRTRIKLLCLSLFCSLAAMSQPGTEVMLLDLSLTTDNVLVENPRNVSNHEGYDNQPHFLSNSKALFYTSQQGDQTEVVRFDFMSGEIQKITSSDGGEYSPTPMPDSQHFSTIILESSGLQLLWKYDLNGQNPQVLVPDLKIGYHCWLEDDLIAAFVLGEPSTLQLCNLTLQENKIIASNIGRSLHKIPGTSLLSYVDKSSEPWSVNSYDPKTGTSSLLINCLEASEDMAWAVDGSLFMGQGSQLFVWRGPTHSGWQLVADLQDWGMKDITRLAINPEGTQIAVVVADPE